MTLPGENQSRKWWAVNVGTFESDFRKIVSPELARHVVEKLRAGETVEFPNRYLQLSKRAARRLIQRALVLTGRDRHVREHIREARLTMLWVLEDWGFAWTVHL